MATATATTTAQAASKSTTTTATTTPTMARDAEEEHQLLSDEASSTFSADAETEQLDMLRSKWDTPDPLDDSVLRYSFKGSPPEEYSPKKEYIYTQPLVKQELVVKKICTWWIYKNKNNFDMSTHWLRPCVWISVGLVVIISLLFFSTTFHSAQSSPGEAYSIELEEIKIPKVYSNLTDNASDDDKSDGDNFDDIGDDNLSAFVIPIKVHNISLNEEDLLYESKRQGDASSSSSQRNASSAFSMTGTFRNLSSEIWDPHPQYMIEAFGHRLHLMLKQDTSFIPTNTFKVIRILNNQTEDYEDQGHYLGCYYKGHVEGHNQSSVSVSLCSGMTGYIKTGFGTLLIQPVNRTNSDQIEHRVWRHSQRNPRHAVSGMDTLMEAFELAESMLEDKTESSVFSKVSRRRKRHFLNTGNQVYTLEVLIAVDHTMVEFHGQDLYPYILILFSIVSNIFADASIGNNIHIALLNPIVLNDSVTADRGANRRGSGTNERLKHFCSFLAKKGYYYDTAMLITRDQICGNERDERCSTLGLAELGTVCKARSCSIVQDNGLPAAFTIAHELGHILNMPHDDDERCKQHNTKGNQLHIMSSIMGDHMHPYSWSKCSQHYVSEFLEKTDKSCLENSIPSYMPNLNTKLPGEIYSLDQQCQLIHGNLSTHCTFEADCRRLFCNKNNHPNEVCTSSNLPWADGTPCNNNHYWCQKGSCVPRDDFMKLVHGGWGPWSAFTPCSLTCGGGVQESRRECNNPLPENGGKYCVGSRKKYRSCNTHACPPGTPDPREQQCYDMNGRNFKIQGISPNSKWVPKYGLNTHVTDKCKLYCRVEDDSAYFLLKEMVKDGTTCTVDSFDKCVNGICRPAGCDNELNSIAKLDKCGVCEGNNDTCEELTGNVYVSDLLKQKKPASSLYYVTTIPKGAANIIITQPGYPEQNYIVLSDDNHVALLNSDKVVTPYAKKYSYAGVTLDYNGSNSTVERVNSTYSWKLTRDLRVEIISIDLTAAKNQNTVLISYSYTVDRTNYDVAEVEIYRWQMQTWSTCDSLCQGTMHRQAACVSTTQGVKVASQYCDESAMPRPEYRSCNMDCVLTLNTTSISECSAACGELGTREKTFNCIQTFPHIQRSNIVDMSYCQLKFEIVRHEDCREGCWNYTDWSTCTQTCGIGSQVREVRCYLNQAPVSDEHCNPRTKHEHLDLIRSCNMEPCRTYPPVTVNTHAVSQWMTGEWGECSDWCKMNRTVTCMHSYGDHCPLDKKPKEVRNCCHIKYMGEWEPCSVECGTGIKRKIQRCVRVYKSEVPGAQKRKELISDSYCTTLKVRKPTLRKSRKVCKINCRWNSSNWTGCSKDCSDDYQTRRVRCETWQGNSVSEQHCDPKKRPSRRKICTNCMRKQHKVLSACDCSGYERRRILYYDSHMRRVDMRPKVEKVKCAPPASCRIRSVIGSSSSIANSVSSRSRRAQTCADLQQMYRQYADGEYMLEVRSRSVRIYCHQMNSATPREYITVEPQENYSIFYEYKTKLFDSCPPASRAHEYVNDLNSGRTYFRKLRLNISDLRIIENDFEFAESRGQRQALGSAGDCYNRNMNCPQGDFSISVAHTGFTLRPGTVWNTYGNRAVMKLSSDFEAASESRRAFCGGYCGRCSIAPTSALYVNVV